MSKCYQRSRVVYADTLDVKKKEIFNVSIILKVPHYNHPWVQVYFKFYAGLLLQNANWIDFLELCH